MYWLVGVASSGRWNVQLVTCDLHPGSGTPGKPMPWIPQPSWKPSTGLKSTVYWPPGWTMCVLTDRNPARDSTKQSLSAAVVQRGGCVPRVGARFVRADAGVAVGAKATMARADAAARARTTSEARDRRPDRHRTSAGLLTYCHLGGP